MATKVSWGMIAYGPFPFAPVYVSHLSAIAHAAEKLALRGDGSRIHFVGSSDRTYTHSSENQAVQEFLATDSTHLFLTEMDMVLPTDTIVRLLDLDKPVASGLYFLRNGRGQPCLYAKGVTPVGNPYPHAPVTMFPTERPFKLGATGGCPGLGCVLIRREVFETIGLLPWFDLKAADGRGAGHGSDMYFYTLVRDHGFEVWVDPHVRCGHMDYTEVTFDDYARRLKEDPAFAASGYIIGE